MESCDVTKNTENLIPKFNLLKNDKLHTVEFKRESTHVWVCFKDVALADELQWVWCRFVACLICTRQRKGKFRDTQKRWKFWFDFVFYLFKQQHFGVIESWAGVAWCKSQRLSWGLLLHIWIDLAYWHIWCRNFITLKVQKYVNFKVLFQYLHAAGFSDNNNRIRSKHSTFAFQDCMLSISLRTQGQGDFLHINDFLGLHSAK